VRATREAVSAVLAVSAEGWDMRSGRKKEAGMIPG
jgi:hypothetical protein